MNLTQKKIRLVICDLDGTLISSQKVLTEATLTAIHQLHLAQVQFAIVTGRPAGGTRFLLKDLDLRLPIASFNGGLIADPVTLKTIEQHALKPETSRAVIDRLKKMGLDVWIYRQSHWYVRDADAPHVEKEKSTVRIQPDLVPNFEGLTDEIVKIVGISDDFPLVEQAESTMRESFGQAVSAARSQPYYLDVTHPEANKGAVVSWFSKKLGIPFSEIATLGDMPSDIRMFEKSGLSVAMGNASRAVKASATEVTQSNDEDGFAYAVERFILNNCRTEKAS